MTVALILAGKGRDVTTTQPHRTLLEVANVLAEKGIGAVIVPGDPANSLLIKLIRHEGPANDPMPMPPKSKLSDADIATITEWIRSGAVMP